MKVVIAVAGTEGEAYFRRTVEMAAADRAEEIILVHVIDVGPRHDLEAGRERLLGRPLGEARQADLVRAEDERAQAALQFARQAMLAAGISEQKITDRVLRGKPNEELRRLAEANRALIVVGGRAGKPGPHSLGKTARYVIDHAAIA